MTSPQPPAHRPRKDGRWPLQRPTLPPGVSDGRGWVTVNRPTRPDHDPARLINRRACALRLTLTWHISSIWFRKCSGQRPQRPISVKDGLSIGIIGCLAGRGSLAVAVGLERCCASIEAALELYSSMNGEVGVIFHRREPPSIFPEDGSCPYNVHSNPDLMPTTDTVNVGPLETSGELACL